MVAGFRKTELAARNLKDFAFWTSCVTYHMLQPCSKPGNSIKRKTTKVPRGASCFAKVNAARTFRWKDPVASKTQFCQLSQRRAAWGSQAKSHFPKNIYI